MSNLDKSSQIARIELARRELARRNVLDFTKYTFPMFQDTWFHRNYYRILDTFAKKHVKNLIITMPPQHGKSEGSSRKLPSYILGLDKDTKIAIASYNQTFARKFNREVQRIIDDPLYYNLFPGTALNNSRVAFAASGSWLRNTEEFEVVDSRGGLKVVGRGGPLTGNPVDVGILDDVYKDYAEANSPIIREAAQDWYSSVVRTRLHNDSQQIIVFTRWHEEDLIGWLELKENVVELHSWSQLENPRKDVWYKINFEAIKTGQPTEIDPRQPGEPLWPERHSIERLLEMKALDAGKFKSLYQGNPQPSEGLLYSGFNTYQRLPNGDGIGISEIKSYTDTADTGNDYLCNIIYGVGTDDLIYVMDVYYTPDQAEITEPETARRLSDFDVQRADIESNAGGRAFARNVYRLMTKRCNVVPFHQSKNKESRIISNSADVCRKIVFPSDWTERWPEFARDLLGFRRLFKANRNDDAPDTLTGVLEKNGFAGLGFKGDNLPHFHIG